MVYVRRVVGVSMEPTLKAGQLCIFIRRGSYQTGEVVLAYTGDREVVKRIDGRKLRGDNRQFSTDYDLSPGTHIRGRLVWPKTAQRTD